MHTTLIPNLLQSLHGGPVQPACTAAQYTVPCIETRACHERMPCVPYCLPASQDNICPQQNGVPYAVDGFPGTPFLQTPFSTLYQAAPVAQPSITVCRTNTPDPKHCMSAYEITVSRALKRPFDTTIPACAAFPATELFGYNGMVPGPTIQAPV